MAFAKVLPSECVGNIVSFLNISDCVGLSSTSLSSLREVLPELFGRRSKMKLRYAIWIKPMPVCPSPKSVVHHDHDSIGEVARVDTFERLLQEQYPAEQLTTFATVQERVNQLALLMPPSHPSYHMVRELSRLLREKLDYDATSLKRAELVNVFKIAIAPLRHHALILRNALDGSCDSGRVPLGKYIGDVLAVTYLLQQSDRNCSFSEGSPTQLSIADSAFPRQSCYRSWILAHASTLRIKHFSVHDQERLGIRALRRVSKSLETNSPSQEEVCSNDYDRWLLPTSSYRTACFLASEMTLVYDDFGPLGPTFRGRDIVRIREISAHTMMAALFGIRSDDDPFRLATEWMCLAHDEATKRRPMTVREPVVEFG